MTNTLCHVTLVKLFSNDWGSFWYVSCTDTSLHDRDISQRVQSGKSTVLALHCIFGRFFGSIPLRFLKLFCFLSCSQCIHHIFRASNLCYREAERYETDTHIELTQRSHRLLKCSLTLCIIIIVFTVHCRNGPYNNLVSEKELFLEILNL